MTNRSLSRDETFTEAIKLLKEGYDLYGGKISVQNMYADVSALLDRLEAHDLTARGEALTLFGRMRDAI